LSSATITDVAKRVGVSVATISRYLSGFTVRSEEEIRAAIVELNYRPNAAARNLKSGRTGIIAIVVPDVTNPFFAAIVEGAESAVGDDRMILLVNTGDSHEREEKALGQLFGRVDGVILAPLTEDEQAPSFFSQFGLPIVFVDRVTADGENFSSVLADNRKGSELATNYLISHGHTKIAMINGPERATPAKGRSEGFQNALSKANINPDPQYFRESDFTEAGGYQAMLELIELDAPPTAVFTANNLMTIGALHALQERGVSVPSEISLIGFDDLDFADLINPPLTVIARDARLQGSLAMNLMIKHLENGAGSPPQHSIVDVQLVERGSCAPARQLQKIRFNK
jgi:DNA-binding LacI/PurR family transcriptional regulator